MTLRLQKSNSSWQACALHLVASNVQNSKQPESSDAENSIEIGKSLKLTNPASVARKLAAGSVWSGSDDVLCQAEIDHWMDFAAKFHSKSSQDWALRHLERELTMRTVLVGIKDLTLADIFVFASLKCLKSVTLLENTQRYMNFLDEKMKSPVDGFASVQAKDDTKTTRLQFVPDMVKPKTTATSKPAKTEDNEAKYPPLENGKIGEVVTRFPPEASGYLHIGHAKAALLNYHYRNAYQGKLIMRFDDTNPEKENEEFEKIILEDVKLLGIKYDHFSYTSDHFELMKDLCEKLIRDGKAFCDNTPAEGMKALREQFLPSVCRDYSVAENLKMWEGMKIGSVEGKKTCVRAKMDFASTNGAMRDPTIYRCKDQAHPRHGNKYKAYPTYDFACPIVDSIEGVTHAMRTTEYLDRDDQYKWFLAALELKHHPHIWSYSRLNLQNTVLSKRKLAWLVEQNIVDGWNDARFPTVRGVLRAGMTVEGLQKFIAAQGGSVRIVNQEWDKIWAFNKQVIDPIAKRLTAVDAKEFTLVNVSGKDSDFQSKQAAYHPKNPELGEKSVSPARQLLIESPDAESFKEGENVTFMNWGNLMINKINKKEGKVSSIDATANLEDLNFKKTLKVSWIPKTTASCPVKTVHFKNIISKGVLEKDDDFKDFVNKDSRAEFDLVGDSALKELKKGDFIQLVRRGYFIVDQAYGGVNPHTCIEQPIVLYNVPDGSMHDGSLQAGGKAGKKADKAAKPVTSSNNKVKGAAAAAVESAPKAAGNSMDLYNKCKSAGDKVRKLKSEKAGKDDVMAAVGELKIAKTEYKASVGSEYDEKKPPQAAAAAAPVAASNGAMDLYNKCKSSGDNVRKLKTEKAAKDVVMAAVGELKAAKTAYKASVGSEYDEKKPPQAAAAAAAPVAASNGAMDLYNKCKSAGDNVRKLKSEKAAKDVVMAAVGDLKSAKTAYNASVGSEYDEKKPPQAAAAPVATAVAHASSSGSSKSMDLYNKCKAAGDKVRQLKSEKAGKDAVMAAVGELKIVKAEYKSVVGSEYDEKKPPQTATPAPSAALTAVSSPSMSLYNKCKAAGDAVRKLKSEKAGKDAVMAAVGDLKTVKAEYKSVVGSEYDEKKPPQAAAPAPSAAPVVVSSPPMDLYNKCKAAGDAVRKLKSEKAGKDAVMAAVGELKTVKAEYKSKVGSEYDEKKPPQAVAATPAAAAPAVNAVNPAVLAAFNKTKSLGDQVRELKSKKQDVGPTLASLKEAKATYKSLTGTEYTANKPPTADMQAASKPAAKPVQKPKQAPKQVEKPQAGTTRLGIEHKKAENLSGWYKDVILKAEMIEYYDVSGCYILRPWSFAIWDSIKDFFDAEIKKLGVENCYFPMFVSKAALEKEQDHIEDFAPEVAWVTRSGTTELAEPIAVRPTSETVMYPAYANWIQSHRDLPIKLNQWCNVVRWEFKHPTPFLRTREFLWQEGHTAYATQPPADEEVLTILDLYAQVYSHLLAIPVVPGRKTEKEKFAGGDYTTTVEAYISAAGRAIQGATSHHLGQNFAKMFDLSFEDPKNKNQRNFAYQNSWGITTRTIGVMIMVHGDDKGLVLPPNVAHVQVVLIPTGAPKTEEDREKIVDRINAINKRLLQAGIKSKTDLRDHVTPGWKYAHWEQKGVPLRLEVGPRDLESGGCILKRRVDDQKVKIDSCDDESFGKAIKDQLQNIHETMLAKSTKDLNTHLRHADTWQEFVAALNDQCLVQAPFCGDKDCETDIKDQSAIDTGGEALEAGAPSMGAKSLCIPFEPIKKHVEGTKCIKCGNGAICNTMFGRSY